MKNPYDCRKSLNISLYKEGQCYGMTCPGTWTKPYFSRSTHGILVIRNVTPPGKIPEICDTKHLGLLFLAGKRDPISFCAVLSGPRKWKVCYTTLVHVLLVVGRTNVLEHGFTTMFRLRYVISVGQIYPGKGIKCTKLYFQKTRTIEPVVVEYTAS